MKKLIMMATLALCVAGVSAQKGTMYLGTTGVSLGLNGDDNFTPITGFTFGTDESNQYLGLDDDLEPVYGDVKTKNMSVGLAPEIGYFVSDNLAIGAALMFKYSTTETEDADNKVATTTFGISPYARYYFLTSGKFKMYGQAGFTYASSNTDVDGSKATNYLNVGVLPGVSYNLSDRVAINATYGFLGYDSYNDKNTDSKESNFGLTLDMSSLRFGFSVAF